jgi:cytochrome d ubiquinol oxidase subunit II
MAFFIGSLAATFAQGITLGALLYGIHVEGRLYAGGWCDWLSLYSLMTGAGLVAGYALLGAGWLIWKTEGDVHVRARRLARILLPLLLAAIGAVSLYTPFVMPQYFERWLRYPGLLVTVPMPVLFGAVTLALWWALGRGRDWLPFLLSLGLFLLSMAGLAISIWPDVIPGRVTIWQAAAPYASQSFMLIGAAVLMPLILAYTGWAYWVFRGKVGEHGYH